MNDYQIVQEQTGLKEGTKNQRRTENKANNIFTCKQNDSINTTLFLSKDFGFDNDFFYQGSYNRL